MLGNTSEMEVDLAFAPVRSGWTKPNFFCLEGHGNLLKRLISDKEMAILYLTGPLPGVELSVPDQNFC
jgi:hypothetical protein